MSPSMSLGHRQRRAARGSARRRLSPSRARAIPKGALHELFGFAGFRPGQREAVEAARRGPRRAGGDADRLGQVALLPAAGAHAGGPDGRGLAARLADAGSGAGGRAVAPRVRRPRQRPAGHRENRRTLERAAGASCGCSTWRPSGSRRRVPERIRARGSASSWSTRRTACRSGARLPARLLPARRRRPLARRAAIVASTATATPHVAADIVGRLGLRDPVRVATGFDRPNLSFAVVACREQGRRSTAGSPRRSPSPGALPGIVYAGTRAESERLAARLGGPSWAWTAIPYHAGSPREARSEAQRRFMAGERPGRRSPPTRSGWASTRRTSAPVCHESVPSSLEAYYQEAAARDAMGSRPAVSSSPPARTRACMSSSSSGRRWRTTR
jgi:ATP-dependent DNA helicase RecQ